jgi:hypothetical protein
LGGFAFHLIVVFSLFFIFGRSFLSSSCDFYC